MGNNDLERDLRRWGMITAPGGVQLNACVSTRKVVNGLGYEDADVCDHRCKDPYKCPALDAGGNGIFAPAEKIIRSADIALRGVKEANRRLAVSSDFRNYCEEFLIPNSVREIFLKTLLGDDQYEFNLFGGDPEMLKDSTEIIAGIKSLGYKVNFTTTGRRFMTDTKFTERVMGAKPDLIAVSCDFASPDEIRMLGGMKLEEIKKVWREKILPTGSGQRQKAYEAAYVLRMAQEIQGFPKVMVNTVLHKDNIRMVGGMMAAIRQGFGDVMFNPYPAQQAFDGERANLASADLPILRGFVEWAIEQTADGNKFLAPRLQYWLMLLAAMTDVSEQEAINASAGYGVWSCSGARRYLQVGLSPRTRQDKDAVPGLWLNCYWNHTAIFDGSTKQVYNMSPDDVADYIERPMAGSCTCIFPRLNLDAMNVERGMNRVVAGKYLPLRKQHAKF